MISSIRQFIEKGVWEIRLKDLPPGKAFSVRCLRVPLLAFQGFLKNHDEKTSSILTYYSLLSLVPVLGVAFGIAKGFSLEKLIEKQIYQMAQQSNLQMEIANRLLGFSQSLLEHAKGGVIAGIGVVMIFWTVISILGRIEDSFNVVWQVKRPRSLTKKFTDYLTMMVFTPIFFVLSSSVTILVAGNVTVVVHRIALLRPFSAFILFVLNLLPYFSIWILFVLLYLVMPNTRVPLRSAVAGGIVAGTIFQVVQWAYIRFQIGASYYGAIYGSFAALPLFLVWAQLSWMIVLFGVEFAYAYEHYETFGFHPDYSRISEDSKKRLLLVILHFLVKRFSGEDKSMTLNRIAYALEIPIVLLKQLLSEMMEVGLVAETCAEEGEAAFQPGRPLDRLTIQYVLDLYERRGDNRMPAASSEAGQKISKFLKEISEMIEKSPANIRLADI